MLAANLAPSATKSLVTKVLAIIMQGDWKGKVKGFSYRFQLRKGRK